MKTYRVTLLRSVVTTEYFLVEADGEQEAVMYAQNGNFQYQTSDLVEEITEVNDVEEVK